MRIHRTHGDAWLLDAPPASERIGHSSAGPDHALGCQQRGNIPEGHMRCHQHHAEGMAPRILGHAFRGEHHGDVYIAGQMRQPFGVARVGKACEVEGVLVSWGCYDCVYFSTDRESDGGLNGVAGDAARTDDAVTILARVTATQSP